MTNVRKDEPSFMSSDYVPGLVSVIIPTYNRQEFVQEAILSALNQTYSPVEVIVVDDGSTDKTEELVQSVAKVVDSGRLRYARQPHLGAPVARNHGLRLSRGEFIQFLDSDDVIHPEKIEKQVALLLSRKDLQMTYCTSRFFDRSPGDSPASMWQHMRWPDIAKHVDHGIWPTDAPLWRRGAIVVIGPWNTNLAVWQNYEYDIRALSLGVKAVGTDGVLNYVRNHRRDRIRLEPLSVRRARSFLLAAQLVSNHVMRAGVATRTVREILAARAGVAGLMFFQLGLTRGARRAFAFALSLRPSTVRRFYLRSLSCMSCVFCGDWAAKLIAGLKLAGGVFARAVHLLPVSDDHRASIKARFQKRGRSQRLASATRCEI